MTRARLLTFGALLLALALPGYPLTPLSGLPLDLPAILLLLVMVGWAILLPGAQTRRAALVLQGRRALRLLAASAFFLIFAGAIEGLISPRPDLPFAFKATVAAASAVLIIVYASLGRGASADETREVIAYRHAAL